MKLAFTTLGCPNWDIDTICQKGAAFGYDGVDFRGLQDEIDITKTPEFTTRLSETKKMLADAGLAVPNISTSISVCVPEKVDQFIEEAKRTIPIANELGTVSLRVFGNGDVKTHTKETLADFGQSLMEKLLALDGGSRLKWVFETHDHWIASQDCKLLLDRIPNPAFGALWDMGHTTRVGGEAPAETLAALGNRVYYTHIKDAIYDTAHPEAMKDGWRYVSPGQGQLPLSEAIALLKSNGYDGWVMFEHEKRWHMELPEPEEIFPEFVSWFKSLPQ
jgi:sugar phosphate isomerase/epimerase